MKPIHAVAAGVALLLGVGMHHVLAQKGPAELIPRLRNEYLAVRFEAAYALGDLGAEARPAVPALIELLRSEDHDDTEMATFVLARIAPDPAVEAAVPLLTETVRGLEKGWTAQFNAAVALLKLGREEEKARAVLRDELYLGLMLPLLKDEKPVNRLHVCEALGLAGLPRPDILELLRKTGVGDPDARVREAAQKALKVLEAQER
jgi:HEAT repeat protein